jgi:hypothetical protein
MHKYIHQIEEKRQAIFVGFFGPIGVSAVFYLYISIEFLETITVDGVMRGDAKQVADALTLVVWFLAICSIVSHVLIRKSLVLTQYRLSMASVSPWASSASSSHEHCPGHSPLQEKRVRAPPSIDPEPPLSQFYTIAGSGTSREPHDPLRSQQVPAPSSD